MKTLILGLGAQGSVIASHLTKDEEVTEVRLADIDLVKAERLAMRLKNDKVCTHRVDASKVEEIVEVAKGVDLVVNATSFVWKLIENSMEAAIKVGANYIDLAGSRQLQFNEKWRDAGLTALIGAGEDPGISNILAREGADMLDRIDEIRIKDWGSIESTEIIFGWCPPTVWSDLAASPSIYVNGEHKRLSPFSGEEVYKFPDPIGQQTVFHHAHEEVGTLSRFIEGVKYVEFKLGTPEVPIAKFIIGLGLMKREPIEVGGVKVTPRDVLIALTPPTLTMDEVEEKIKAGILTDEQECILVEVKGEEAGKEMKITFYTTMSLHEANKLLPGATGVAYLTGTSGAVFAKMLLNAQITTRGAIPPECLTRGERTAYLGNLAKMGIIIHEKVERTIN